jgi:hypothetical protein
MMRKRLGLAVSLVGASAFAWALGQLTCAASVITRLVR